MNLKSTLLAALCSLSYCAGAQQWRTFTPQNSLLPFSKIYSIGLDENYDVPWVSTNIGSNTDTGVAYVENFNVHPIGPNTGLIYSICSTNDALWFLGTNFLMRLGTGGWSYEVPDDGLNVGMLAYANPLVVDGQQQLWMRPLKGGLLRLANDSWSWFKADTLGLPTDTITDLCTGGDTLWIATYTKGLVRHVNDTFISYNTDNSEIGSDTILKICESRNGGVWMISNDQRLIRFNGNSFTTYSFPQLYFVTDIVEDSFANVWIATSHGLYRFDNGTFTAFNTSNSGLPDDHVTCIATDSKNNLWIGTFESGLTVYNKNGVPAGLKHFEQDNTILDIYPNPASDKLYVTLSDHSKAVKYTITDLMGHKWEKPANSTEIDLSGLKQGMYILEVQTENGLVRKQFFRE